MLKHTPLSFLTSRIIKATESGLPLCRIKLVARYVCPCRTLPWCTLVRDVLILLNILQVTIGTTASVRMRYNPAATQPPSTPIPAIFISGEPDGQGDWSNLRMDYGSLPIYNGKDATWDPTYWSPHGPGGGGPISKRDQGEEQCKQGCPTCCFLSVM